MWSLPAMSISTKMMHPKRLDTDGTQRLSKPLGPRTNQAEPVYYVTYVRETVALLAYIIGYSEFT